MRVRLLWCLLVLLGITTSTFAAKPALRMHEDGTFKIVMFSDTQDDESLDPRTTSLMERILDTEKPDFVVIGGDCLAGKKCETAVEVTQAIANIAAPMEQRGIPWAIVFGNHDQEHFPKTKLSKADVIGLYQKHPHNLNVRGETDIHGAGNDVLLVRDRTGRQPIFSIWLLDSGEYALGGYEWIHSDQIAWYVRTSQELERQYKHTIPGIMYFHIPLLEFTEMAKTGQLIGDRFENEGSSKINGGLFSAVLDRGDVNGIFCGHAHINNYVGEWHGVRLGQDATVGYSAYNVPDDDPRSTHTRGGRVFLIKESDPQHWQTWMRFVDGSISQ